MSVVNFIYVILVSHTAEADKNFLEANGHDRISLN